MGTITSRPQDSKIPMLGQMQSTYHIVISIDGNPALRLYKCPKQTSPIHEQIANYGEFGHLIAAELRWLISRQRWVANSRSIHLSKLGD